MTPPAISPRLQNHRLNRIAVALFISVASILFFSGIPQVPFHPDESTQLYMSADFDRFLVDPMSMAWKGGQPDDPQMQYRLLDAPLTRYLLGISRYIMGQPPLFVDWDWSKTWQENQREGALPAPDLLLSGRWIMAIFYPLSLFLIFLIGLELGGNRLAWIAMLLLATNALVLLHTRRAMAEGILLFTSLLSLLTILKAKSQPWLSSIPIALAFCAKQSSAPLILIGLAAIFLHSRYQQRSTRFLVSNLLIFLSVFSLLYLFLNPFTWSNPIQATLAAFQARQELLSQQVDAIQSVSPEQILASLPMRLAAMLGNLFFTPPAVADIANYLNETQTTSDLYFSSGINALFRDPIFGSIFLLVCLTGFAYGLLTLKRRGEKQSAHFLLLLAVIVQIIFQLVSIPLTFQRYVIPLIPYSVLYIAFGTDFLMDRLIAGIKQK